MIYKKIEHPEEVEFIDDGFLSVLGGTWNSLEGAEPIKWKDTPSEFCTVTLKDIQEQYADRYGMIIVVHETYLSGEVYRLGNYSDGLWYQIG